MNYAPMSAGYYQQFYDDQTGGNGGSSGQNGGLNSQAASRSSMSLGAATPLDQFNDFPAWMPRDNNTTNTQQLTQFQKQIPGLLNTAGVEKSYHNQIDGMMAQGRGHAAAAGQAYGQRAIQAGASGMGAGFAQAQAMLPMYAQQGAMLSDLAGIQQRAKAGQASEMGGAASQLSSMAAQREGMMTDYAQNQQRFALQNRQLQQQAQQWSQGNQSWGGGNRTGGGSEMASAQAILSHPEAHSYALDMFGKPMSFNDGMQYAESQAASAARRGAMGYFSSMARY